MDITIMIIPNPVELFISLSPTDSVYRGKKVVPYGPQMFDPLTIKKGRIGSIWDAIYNIYSYICWPSPTPFSIIQSKSMGHVI